MIICDINLPNINGLDLSKRARKLDKNIKIILISGIENIIESINSIEIGVYDFLTKPVDTRKLSELIKKAIEDGLKTSNNALVESLYDKTDKISIKEYQDRHNGIVCYGNNYSLTAASMDIRNMLLKLDKLRDYPEIPVLIEGKTGTGKEVAAQYLHYGMTGSDKPFIALNCGAISANLFEAELFGYDKGAFTGADPRGKNGKISLAENGTLFLDEITEISLEMQVKLLRVIQEKEYFKVGGNIKYPVKARIVCAGNRSIPRLIQEGLFREDLYYRLNVCKIYIPSLKQRREDITPLVIYFMDIFNLQNHTGIKEIQKSTFEFLENYDWPGNIRELKNAVFKAMLFNEKKYLSTEDFSFLTQLRKKEPALKLGGESVVLPNQPFSLEEFNKKIIEAALSKFSNNKTKAAEFLGLNRVQMYYRYKTKKD